MLESGADCYGLMQMAHICLQKENFISVTGAYNTKYTYKLLLHIYLMQFKNYNYKTRLLTMVT